MIKLLAAALLLFTPTVHADNYTTVVPAITAGSLPSDGYADTYVNITGDTMTGPFTTTSSITVESTSVSEVGITVSSGLTVSAGVVEFQSTSEIHSVIISSGLEITDGVLNLKGKHGAFGVGNGITFGADKNTGFHEISADTLRIVTAGSSRWDIDSTGFLAKAGAGSPNIMSEAATGTNPIYTYSGDNVSGLGRNGVGRPTMVSNSIEVATFEDTGTTFTSSVTIMGDLSVTGSIGGAAADDLEIFLSSGNSVATSISATLKFEILNGTTTAGISVGDMVHVSPWGIQYIGATTRDFRCGTVLTLSGTNNAKYALRLQTRDSDGVTILDEGDKTEQRHTVDSNNAEDTTGLSGIIRLTQNDIVQIVITDVGGTSNPTAEMGNFDCEALD